MLLLRCCRVCLIKIFSSCYFFFGKGSAELETWKQKRWKCTQPTLSNLFWNTQLIFHLYSFSVSHSYYDSKLCVFSLVSWMLFFRAHGLASSFASWFRVPTARWTGRTEKQLIESTSDFDSAIQHCEHPAAIWVCSKSSNWFALFDIYEHWSSVTSNLQTCVIDLQFVNPPNV